VQSLIPPFSASDSGDTQRIPVGVSQCLLGARVRFDGGHKHSTLCTASFARLFEYVPFCPEVAIGLGTPRQPIRLVGSPGATRVVGTRDASLDVTQPLGEQGAAIPERHPELRGFILMQKSPSCGMERVKVYNDDGQPAQANGTGAFAAALMKAWPLLPVEEEGRLHDPVLRENFVTRVVIYADWRRLLESGPTSAALISFHSRYKYLLMAHHREHYQTLGRLVADFGKSPQPEKIDQYAHLLMACLKTRATRRTHSNVLEHLAGHFKRVLGSAQKQELRSLIDAYRSGTVPLVVPITLLKHHLLNHPDPFLLRQAYLQPHPAELSLRNAI
jgi:uncharacterized protein YbgA (DUF1722 family)/uncharacterized protein YbbK (DUF523 family)